MRGEHRAPSGNWTLVLTLVVMVAVFVVWALWLAVWSAATVHQTIERLPILNPSPSPESWLDQLHDLEDAR